MKNLGMTALVSLCFLVVALSGLSTSEKQDVYAAQSIALDPFENSERRSLVDEDIPRVVDFFHWKNPNGVDMYIRFWSNGVVDRIQSHLFFDNNCGCLVYEPGCIPEWEPVPGTTEGYLPRSDLNGDNQINGEDLAIILAGWGSSSATLLTNPQIGGNEVVSIATNAKEDQGGWLMKVSRIWDTGVIQIGFFHAPRSYGGGECDCDDYCPTCETTWCTMPATLPAHVRVGDINADTSVDGVDLAELLGSWGR